MLISIFMTYTTFEALFSSYIKNKIDHKTIKRRLANQDKELALKAVDFLQNWATKGRFLDITGPQEDVRKLIRIQRALRRASEKLGEVVEEIIRERLIEEKIPVDWPDISLKDLPREKVDMCIPNRSNPHILIEVKFHNSHGTKMQRDAEKIVKLASYVNKKDLWLIAVIDGAGWWFRKNDLKRILSVQGEKVSIYQLRDLDEMVRSIKRYMISRNIQKRSES